MAGKTIQIFLPDGNPKGVRKASITTDRIEILQIPRVNLNENKKMLDFNGVYVLVDSLKTEKPEIYIGKGDVKTRTSSHDSKKDFWNVVFAIRLKGDTGFNDAHNSYLEYYFIQKAHHLNQAVMNENKQAPRCPELPEEIIAEMECYIDTIETLFSTLGLKCFQPIENSRINQKDILYCIDKYGNSASGEYTEEGFLMYKGAICEINYHNSSKPVPLRQEMITSGELKPVNGHLILQNNKLFSSVSTAATIVTGRNSNGWREWRNKDGKTLDELERK